MIIYMLKAFHEHLYDGKTEVDGFLIGFFDSVEKCKVTEHDYTNNVAGFSLPAPGKMKVDTVKVPTFIFWRF